MYRIKERDTPRLILLVIDDYDQKGRHTGIRLVVARWAERGCKSLDRNRTDLLHQVEAAIKAQKEEEELINQDEQRKSRRHRLLPRR